MNDQISVSSSDEYFGIFRMENTSIYSSEEQNLSNLMWNRILIIIQQILR